MNEIIGVVKAEVADPEARKRIYGPIFRVFRDQDWDTVDESLGLDRAFNATVKDAIPEWFEGDNAYDVDEEFEGEDEEGG